MTNQLNLNLNNFNDIEDLYLRAYNRLVVAFNLNSEGHKDKASKYISQFGDEDKVSIAVVTSDIQTQGWTAVKKLISEKLASAGNLIDDFENDPGFAEVGIDGTTL